LSGVVFDSSVILAAILGEPGGDDVFDRIEDALVSTVNVAEVYTYAAINGFPTEAIDAFFADTGIAIKPFSHDQAITAGGFAAKTRKAGLSLGDRACLALAAAHGVDVLTADHPWEAVADDLGIAITFLR
jgi:ribonuclease VapC